MSAVRFLAAVALASAWPAHSIDWDGFVSRADSLDPVLRASKELARASDDPDLASSAWPDMRLSVDAEEFVHSREGLRATELTATLSQAIPLGDPGAARRRILEAERSLATLQARRARQGRLSELARQWVDAGRSCALEAWSSKSVLVADSLAAFVERRRSAGLAERPDEAALVRSEAALALSGLAKATRERRDALALLMPSIASDSSCPERPILGSPDPRASSVDWQRTLAGREAEQRRALATSEVDLARADGRGELEVAGGVRMHPADPAGALVAGISLPIGRANRNRLERARADRQRLVLESELRQAHARWEAEQARRNRAIASLRMAREDRLAKLIPAALEAERLARRGWEKGLHPLSAVLAARRNLLELEHADIEETWSLAILELEQALEREGTN